MQFTERRYLLQASNGGGGDKAVLLDAEEGHLCGNFGPAGKDHGKGEVASGALSNPAVETLSHIMTPYCHVVAPALPSSAHHRSLAQRVCTLVKENGHDHPDFASLCMGGDLI